MASEYAFTMDMSSIKFGAGATREVGSDMRAQGATRVLVLTDANLAAGRAVETAMRALKAEGLDTVLFDQVRVEPTDSSFRIAIDVATEGGFDGYVAVGGGSVIDTAKAANLYATHPADFLAYVNPPIGRGEPVPGRLKTLVAIPTTAGTGSETTGVAIFDYEPMHAKTGIAHRALRPILGIIDPENTRTMPRMVAACSALDVLSHAIESYTALPYSRREAPESPRMRPSYQGANPISDVWSARAVEMLAANLMRALDDPDDDEARGQMMLAAAFAGVGFGAAGIYLP
ncbi:MAG: hydroxyacid-oxoacid transhydrogenase, partial [Thermomicrobiales bacterium]